MARSGFGGALLPLGRPRRVGLFAILVVLAFAGAVVSMAGAAAFRGAQAWTARLSAPATIAVWARGLESADAAAARAEAAVGAVPGVRAARMLDPATDDGLIAYLLGAPRGADARLIAVEAAPGARISTAALGQALAADRLPARIDAGGRLTSPVLRAGTWAIAAAAGAFALIALAIGAAIGMTTARDLGAHHALVEFLHVSGAADGFIAGLFQARFARLALAASLLATLAAMAPAAAWRTWRPDWTFHGVMTPAWADIAAAGAEPVAAVLAAAVASWLVAGRILARSP